MGVVFESTIRSTGVVLSIVATCLTFGIDALCADDEESSSYWDKEREQTKKEEAKRRRVSEGVAGAFRLSLSTEVISSVKTTSEPGDTTVTVTQEGSGLPGGAARVLLGFAPTSFINVGATVGVATSTVAVEIGDAELGETKTSASALGAYFELMGPTGVVRPYGRFRFEVTEATSTSDGLEEEEFSGATVMVGAGLHLFPAEVVSIDVGMDIGHASTDYGRDETTGTGVVGFLGVSGWFGAAGAKAAARQDAEAAEEEDVDVLIAQGRLEPKRSPLPPPPSPEPIGPESSSDSEPPAEQVSLVDDGSEVVVGRLNLALDGGALVVLRTLASGTVQLTILAPKGAADCSGLSLRHDDVETAVSDVRFEPSVDGGRDRLKAEMSVERARELFDAGQDSDLSLSACGQQFPLDADQRRRVRRALNDDEGG